MIALSPMLALVVGIAAAYIFFYQLPNPIVFVIAAAVPYLLCLLWAVGDRRTLRDRGFNPPSPLFALLSGFGYLIARRSRVPGLGPIAMLVVVGVLTFGALPVASLMGQTQGLTNALNIQRTISTSLISQDKAVSVYPPIRRRDHHRHPVHLRCHDGHRGAPHGLGQHRRRERQVQLFLRSLRWPTVSEVAHRL